MAKETNLSFVVGPDVESHLAKMQRSMHCDSKSEVLKRALVLLDVALNAEKEGGRIFIEMGEDKKKRKVITVSS